LERIAARLRRRDPLSRSETAVVFLLSHGLRYQGIGRLLYMSPGTVKHHAHAARRKLDAQDNAQMVAKAIRAGLIA